MRSPLSAFAAAFLLAVCGIVADQVSASSASRYKHYHRAPIIDLNGAEELIGIIREDERVVAVSPQLRILRDTGPICRYELTPITVGDSKGDDFPFESQIIEKADGTAQIRVRSGVTLDCSTSEYAAQLVAVRCADDASRSEPVTLKITVKDTNNHAPEFEAPWYSFDVDEGKAQEIARLYASDADCGHPYGRICRYEITNNQAAGDPFRIDDQGVLSAVRPLNYTQSDSHILTVVAHDCGMLSSKSTLVTVHVRPKCVDGVVVRKNGSGALARPPPVQGVPYVTAGSIATVHKLMPDVEVQLCARDEQVCTVKSADAKVTLQTPSPHTVIDAALLKECGLRPENVDLLPETVDKPKTKKAAVDDVADDDDDDDDEAEEEAAEEHDNDAETTNIGERTDIGEQKKHFFDGKTNAIIVPPTAVKGIVPQKFTLTFSMKHSAGTEEKQSVKQNLLCESDDFGMNRHHFAVYIRHCKLEVLLRRESANAAAEFRAAEWRWQTPTVCDGQWHSYAIVFTDLDNVALFVDGEHFGGSDRNPEILDDWPLHETKQHKTRLVVGACWHGRNQVLVQHFRGHLAKMFLLPGTAEPASAVECLHKRRERLRFTAIDRLVLGESMVFDKTETELSLRAANLHNLSALLQAVEYSVDAATAKSRSSGASSSRRFSVESRVECAEANRSIPLGRQSVRLRLIGTTAKTMTATPSQPTTEALPKLSISGQSLLTTERQSLKSGAPLLPNIQITVTERSKDGMEIDVTSKHRLEWCKVHLKPSRDMDLEYFSSPAALISFLNVDFEHDKQGIMLKGDETAKNYADVLAKIRYYNTRPDSYNKRMYTVHCAMMGGRVLSNEFVVQMDVVDRDGGGELEDAIEKLSGLSKKLDHHDAVGHRNGDDPSSTAIEDEQELLKLEKHFEPSFDQLGANRLQNILEMDLPRPKALLGGSRHGGYEVGQGAIAGGAVAVVVVICIGFLLVLLVIGVLKMRDSGPLPTRRRRARKTAMEAMEWDDNGMGMNITVNPLMDGSGGSGGAKGGAGEAQTLDAYASDGEGSLEDEESYREEDELTDDDDEDGADGAGSVLPHAANSKQGLEWDDSTLGAAGHGGTGMAAMSSSVSKTYCV